MLLIVDTCEMTDIPTGCNTCEYWNENNEFCRLTGDYSIKAKPIVGSCPIMSKLSMLTDALMVRAVLEDVQLRNRLK